MLIMKEENTQKADEIRFALKNTIRDGGSTALYTAYTLGWSEKHKSWKMQQFKADSEPRHSTDFRTIFGIMIG